MIRIGAHPILPISSLMLLCLPTLLAADALPFMPRALVGGGFGGASSVAVADLDRDGDLDVVGTAIDDDDVSWWENRGGDSWLEHPIWTSFGQPLSVVTGDINGDGWTDVVVSRREADTDPVGVAWFRNPRGGAAWPMNLVSSHLMRSVRLADLDRDGALDVVAAGVDHVVWYRNNGVGSFTHYVINTSPFLTAHSVFVGDVDGDGWLDVAGASYGSDEIAWWRNDGTIYCDDCWVKQLVETGLAGAISVTGGDFDRDGDLDLAAAAYLDDDVVWWENEDGVGTSWDDHTIDGSFDGAYSVEAVDVDRDGDLDLLGTARLDDDVVWWENWLPSTSWPTRTIDGSFDGARSAVAGDLDGDGDLDVVAACEFGDAISWWRNRTIHWTAEFPSDLHTSNLPALTLNDLHVADLDADGDLDLVGTAGNSSGDNDVVMWLNTPAGWSWGGVEWDLQGARTIRAGDLDGDGDVDLVVGAGSGDAIHWYEHQDIPGVFFDEHVIATALGGTRGVDLADVDGDGDLDILGIFYTDGWVGWWENDVGDGSSWTEHSVGGLDEGSALRAGDLDLDGDIDVAATSSGDDRVAWFENDDGVGTSWTRRILTESFDEARSIEIADLDGDGWPDLVAAASGADDVAWWQSQGDATPTFVRRDIDTSFDGAYDVMPADLDRDGDLDVVAAGLTALEVSWWENMNGSGSSWGQRPVDSGAIWPAAVAAADLNGDGAADIAAAIAGGQEMKTYRNRGGQHSFLTFDGSPPAMGDGEVAALLRIVPLYLGWADDPDMELRNLNLRIDDGSGTPLTDEQVAGLVANLRIYHDSDHDGVLEIGSDSLLLRDSTISVTASGYFQLNVPHGGLNPRVDASAFQSFFLVVETAPTASSQPPGSFRITLLRGGAVTAMRYYDWTTVGVTPDRFSEVSATVVTAGVIFADGFESGDTSGWSSASP